MSQPIPVGEYRAEIIENQPSCAMNLRKIKELGQHIKQWREVVLQKTPAQTVDHLNRKKAGGEGFWSISDLIRIEQGDPSLSFQHWLEIFSMMDREALVVEAAHDDHGLYLAVAELHVNNEDQQRALEKLHKRRS